MMQIFNNNVIEFACNKEYLNVIPEPQLASKHVPIWFKKIKPHVGRDRDGSKAMTAKKCMPLLDAMTTGYILTTAADIHVITNHDCSIIKARTIETSPFNAIDRHAWQQVASDKWPGFKQDPIKFINYWHIKTKPGWSCLFQAPANDFGAPFTCLSGVVDTDKYTNTVNFPAIWNAANFDDLIPAGTPIVQVIPFKRIKQDRLKVRALTKKEESKVESLQKCVMSRRGMYTNECRENR